MVVSSLGAFALLAVFAELRFQHETTYKAEFVNVTGLEDGNFVRIAGVEVGKVQSVSVRDNNIAVVEFSTDESVVLTKGSRAAVRYENLIGGRYLALEEGAGGVEKLLPGQAIPLSQTEPALDLDALIGGFRPLFRALDPDQVNVLSSELIQAFQGQGATINSFLAQAAALTNTLADRDDLIGQVITNLNVVLGSLADQSKKFDTAVGSLSDLVRELADRKTDVSNGMAYANEAAGTIADLLAQARPPLQKAVLETDRAAGIAVGDREYLDNLLATLPDKYRLLARQGIYGDFFNFYLCELVLKTNGKGGQPVYTRLASQSTGRCAPK
ncbi:MCE family protein [Mycolicibacterium xanthum]|uniref:MCE family protein n=1 Tax=Mycolicibacterium xanthum TaxID=2796469 RepID=UPI0021065193